MSQTRTYRESERLTRLKEQLQAHSQNRPGAYASRWQPQLEAAAQALLNREAFQFDLNGDALWQHYKDRYVNLGYQAMADTLGKAASLTGGYGNSHAQIAAQQTYGSYLQGLYDRIPELYNLALQRYDREGQGLRDRYGLLQELEGGDYDRYRQGLEDWTGERSYLQGLYDSARDFDYGAYRDAVGDEQWQQEFDEALRQFNFKNKLGEFAVTASGRRSSGKGGTGEEEEEPKLEKNRFTTTHKMTWKKE